MFQDTRYLAMMLADQAETELRISDEPSMELMNRRKQVDLFS